MSGSLWFRLLLAVALGVCLTFLALPIVAIFVEAGPGEIVSAFSDDDSRAALWLSLETTLASLALILAFGTPAAYLLASREFRGRLLMLTVIELPLVLPPAVAGIALLAAVGPGGLLGGTLDDLGIRLVFETAGVIVALTFVSAPFFIRQAQASFAALDQRVIEASRTLGSGEARTFARVAVPGALPGLAAGAVLAWARALGEFGATLLFAGSLERVTQTAPLEIYERFASDFDAALALSGVMVVASGALLLSVKLVGGVRLVASASS